MFNDLLQKLTQLCHDVSLGKSPDPQPLFEMTKDSYPDPISMLAEAFGMMIVKIEAREFNLRQTIEQLKKANQELEKSKKLLQEQNKNLKKGLRERFSHHQIVGNTHAMRQLLDSVEKIADTPLNVLIEGETGTGKELIAKAVHFNSSRAEFPFVALNCAALPESLLESELFGIEKGVATGVDQRIGRIEQAHRGTLFLDEIGDMPLSSQAKLLRVLEHREVERIGARRAMAVDVRVVTATNKDLEEEVRAGRFRADLFYRLNVIKLHLPPLRDRLDDIPILVRFFTELACIAMKKRPVSFSDDAMHLLATHSWPGNIRELRNEVERCVALASSSVIHAEDLSESIKKSSPQPVALLPETTASEGPYDLEAAEREAIARALAQTQGNKSQAARLLGISREGLRRKLLRYGIGQ